APILEPRMGRTPAGTGARHVGVHRFRRRRAAVADDGRRAVIAAAERDAGNVEFGASMGREIFAGAAACRFALRRIVLDFGHRLESAEGFGEAPGVGGVPYGERLALVLVALQKPR